MLSIPFTHGQSFLSSISPSNTQTLIVIYLQIGSSAEHSRISTLQYDDSRSLILFDGMYRFFELKRVQYQLLTSFYFINKLFGKGIFLFWIINFERDDSCGVPASIKHYGKFITFIRVSKLHNLQFLCLFEDKCSFQRTQDREYTAAVWKNLLATFENIFSELKIFFLKQLYLSINLRFFPEVLIWINIFSSSENASQTLNQAIMLSENNLCALRLAQYILYCLIGRKFVQQHMKLLESYLRTGCLTN